MKDMTDLHVILNESLVLQLLQSSQLDQIEE